MTESYVQEPAEITVVYPFIKAPHTLLDEDGWYTAMSWRPGTVEPKTHEYPEHCAEHYRVAHGEGHMLLRLIQQVALPKPYRARVFYVRQWRDPDGKEFGKRLLRLCTVQVWKSLCSGYRFPYRVQPYYGDTTPEERAAIGRPWAPRTTRPVQVGVLDYDKAVIQAELEGGAA